MFCVGFGNLCVLLMVTLRAEASLPPLSGLWDLRVPITKLNYTLMSPKRQLAQSGKSVEVDGFILAMMGETKKEPHGLYLGLVSDENGEARPRGKRAAPHSNACTKRRLLAGCTQ